MARGLLDLPFEILGHICQTWCSHCNSAVLSTVQDASTDCNTWNAKPTALVFGLDEGRVQDEGDQSALARLSRTCKHLRAVAQPVLYHDFRTRGHHHLFLFVRTLLRRPDLCPHVQRLNISVSGSGWVYGDDDVVRFEHHARQLGISLSYGTQALISRIFASDGRDKNAGLFGQWWTSFNESDSVVLHDLLLLLLPLVPHVKEAYLQLQPSSRQAINYPVTTGQVIFRLPELTRLSFCPRPANTPSWFLQPDVLPIIVCPMLTSLHLRFCTDSPNLGCGNAFDSDPGILPALPLQHLTILRVTGCRVSTTFLVDLLGQVGPQLTSFTLVLGYPWSTETDGRLLPDDVAPKQVIDSLLPWAETLRAVRIDLSKAMPRAVKLRKADLITSFSHFSRLEVLELDLSCVYIAELDGLLMFGVDTAQADWDLLVNLLPDSLRKFVLDGPTHRVYDSLEELSDCAASGRFPDLVEVRCDDGPVAHLEHLRDRFGIAGVNFSLRVPKYGFRQTLSGLF
jgi:hypothetical protein